MPQDTKVKIPEGSPLPYIAALLSFISAVLIVISERNMFDAPIKYIVIFILLPVIFNLIFAIFAAVLAKRKLQLMILPIALISLYSLIESSGITSSVLYKDWKILSIFWKYNAFETLLSCLLLIVVIIFGILAFIGAFNLSLPFAVTCAANIIINVISQVWHFIRSENFFIPWYLFYEVMYLGAFIVLALAVQNDKKYKKSAYPMAPPITRTYPTPAPMPAPMAPGPKYQAGPAPVMNQPFPTPAADQQYMGRPYMNQQAPLQNQPFDNTQNNMQPEGDIFEKINQLYEMNKKGIITDEEFETKKKELLSKI